jgi:hypothetical protein
MQRDFKNLSELMDIQGWSALGYLRRKSDNSDFEWVTSIDSHTVDSFHASQTAAAGSIPVTAATTGNLPLIDAAALLWGDGSCKIAGSGATDLITFTASAGVALSSGLLLKSIDAVSEGVATGTTDGADSKRLQLGGGGLPGLTRGAYINLHGNEHATYPGVLSLVAGASGVDFVNIFTNSTERLRVAYSGTILANTLVDDTTYRMIINHSGADTLALWRAGAKTATNGTGRLNFCADNSADEKTVYGSIGGVIVAATDGAEDGSVAIRTMKAGTITEAVRVNHLGDLLIGKTSTVGYGLELYRTVAGGTCGTYLQNSDTGASSSVRSVLVAGTQSSQLIQYSSGYTGTPSCLNIYTSDATNGHILFQPGASAKGRWLATGELCINHTAGDGVSKLYVAGAAAITTSVTTKRVVETVTALTPGSTVALDAALGSVFTLTPAQDCTINSSNGVAGQNLDIRILTSGTSSYTLTFGTAFKTTGTLATGTTTAKQFLISFRHDGTNFVERCRTTAM